MDPAETREVGLDSLEVLVGAQTLGEGCDEEVEEVEGEEGRAEFEVGLGGGQGKEVVGEEGFD